MVLYPRQGGNLTDIQKNAFSVYYLFRGNMLHNLHRQISHHYRMGLDIFGNNSPRHDPRKPRTLNRVRGLKSSTPDQLNHFGFGRLIWDEIRNWQSLKVSLFPQHPFFRRRIIF
jgi:hypothetical protein